MNITITTQSPRDPIPTPLQSTLFFVKRGHGIVYSVDQAEFPHPPELPDHTVTFRVGASDYRADFSRDTVLSREAPLNGAVAPAVAVREVHWQVPHKTAGPGPDKVAGIHLFVTRFCNGTIDITMQVSNGTVDKAGHGFCGELCIKDFQVVSDNHLRIFGGERYLGARGIEVWRWRIGGSGTVVFDFPDSIQDYGPGACAVPFAAMESTRGPLPGEPNGAAPGGSDLYPVNVGFFLTGETQKAAQSAIARQRLACYDFEGHRITFNSELTLARGAKPGKITELPCFCRALTPYSDERVYIDYNGKLAPDYAEKSAYSPFDGQHLIRAMTWLEPLIMWYGDQWAIHTMLSLAAEARTAWHPDRRLESYGWVPFSLGNLLERTPRGSGSNMAGREYGWVSMLAAWALSLSRQTERNGYLIWWNWCQKLLAFYSQVTPPSGIALRVEKAQAVGGQTSFWTDYKVPDNKGVAQALEIPIALWGVHCLQTQLGIRTLDWAIVEACVALYGEMPWNPDPWSGKTYGPPKCIVVALNGHPVEKAAEGYGPGEPINGHWILPVAWEAAVRLGEKGGNPARAGVLANALKRLGAGASSYAKKAQQLWESQDLNTYYYAWFLMDQLARKQGRRSPAPLDGLGE